MASAEQQELLELLRSLPPLLSPDLPSPPPSPPRQAARPTTRDGAGQVKRKFDEVDAQAKPFGSSLGLEMSQAKREKEEGAKRFRQAPPPPPPPAPASNSSSRHPPPPPPPALAAHPPTPEMRGSPALPQRPPPPAPAKAKADKEEWRKDWPKERLRKLAAQCRDLGRSLKHKGDAFARSTSSSSDPHAARKDRLRALVHQMDAILLYVFAFSCDDAAGRTCLTANWQSVFGLIGFVRKAAEKETGVSAIIGLCTRMEAIAVYTLSMHEQKALHHKGTQLSKVTTPASPVPGSAPRPPGPPPPPPPPPPADSPSSATTDSPAAASPSTHPPAPPHSSSTSSGPPSQAYSDFLRSFLRASPELFRCQRLYDDSCALLSPSLLSTAFPRTWAVCVQPVNFDHPDVGEFVLPCRPWRFAWPAELGRGTAGHQVAFARMVLEELSEREGLGWQAASVGEGV
ncbi:hypothetical protein JCM8547_006856 [Rhodosporidiobolus lusitaniae]